VSSGEAWYRRTATWRLASRWKDRLLGSERVQDVAGDVYRGWRAHRAAASALRSELPDLAGALDEQRRNLGTIADLCAEHESRFVLVTHPAVWAPDLPEETRALLWMGGVGDFQNERGCPYYTIEALAAGLEAYNEAMRAFAVERDLEHVDLAAALASDPALFYDDVHLNEEGARRAAGVLAEFLGERPPFR